MLKQYKLGFDASGLILFMIIMIPNFIWFAVPAPNDVLRKESVTALIDTIASVCQVMFLAALCVLVNREKRRLKCTPLLIFSIVCACLYYFGWALYYTGIVHPLVILSLTLPPCLAFVLFALDRKNYIAVIPAAGFTVCHLIYGIVNYM